MVTKQRLGLVFLTQIRLPGQGKAVELGSYLPAGTILQGFPPMLPLGNQKKPMVQSSPSQRQPRAAKGRAHTDVDLKAQQRPQHRAAGLKSPPRNRSLAVRGPCECPPWQDTRILLNPSSETLELTLQPTGLSVVLKGNSLCRHKSLLSLARETATAPDLFFLFHQRPSPSRKRGCVFVGHKAISELSMVRQPLLELLLFLMYTAKYDFQESLNRVLREAGDTNPQG